MDDEFLRRCRALMTEQPDQALALITATLRHEDLAAETIPLVGSLIEACRDRTPEPAPALKVALLGQCTTAWLRSALVALSWARRLPLKVEEGAYDNVIQALNGYRESGAGLDIVILLPWLRPSALAASHDEIVESARGFWSQAWRLGNELGARLIQVGYDVMASGPMGNHLGARSGDARLVRKLNAMLLDELPQGAYFVDLEQISGEMGRRNFYDFRRDAWTKQPFSEEGVVALARHLQAATQALVVGPKKVLVVDLDDTLWGGLVGEEGPLGIELGETPEGEAYRAFQRYCKGLRARGVLLAVCSKNNPEDARAPFLQNPSMVLGMDDIAAFDASWDPKSVGLQRIAASLGLGLDSFVYFDDSPFDRDEVRQALPLVEVIDVPAEPAEYCRALESGLWFEATALTTEDLSRAEQYRLDRLRRDSGQGTASLEAYLESLGLTATVAPIDPADMPRVVQLIGKTNQFNLTTRRHPRGEVERMLALPGSVSLTVRVRDRFGDYGLIAVVIAVPEGHGGDTLRIDTWLMSCRVIGRTVEHFTLRMLVEEARARGYSRLLGELVPTPKNALVRDLYERLGFSRLEGCGDAVLYSLDLATATLPVTYVAKDGRPTAA